jgi:hypothetical protein
LQVCLLQGSGEYSGGVLYKDRQEETGGLEGVIPGLLNPCHSLLKPVLS